MNIETEAIFSSTGRLGVSRRQYDRLYVNGAHYSTNPDEVDRNFKRLTEVAERHPDRISRSIFRGLVNEDVMRHISNNDLQPHLEVTLLVKEFTGDNSWFIYIANNRPGRELIVSREAMIEATSIQNKEVRFPLERVHTITEQGYTFVRHIPEDQVDQVHALWGETFGWERQEVDNLRRRLITADSNPSSQRDVWFSAIRDNGTIISVAMAERLSIPSANGTLDLVESTEWRTRDEHAGNGLMTATLGALNAQILSDLRDNPNRLPLIYAECNFQSRSDRAGHGAGFRIPEIINGYAAPQILAQNVLVRDGQPVEEGKLRDFTFMYLPVEAIQKHYNPLQVNSITQMIKA
ncbi:GNAT family N-acetyltransferase [Candidatus Woesebacteria bacterium]|nr:GNAT family N-acetyltransferase [Candidatus Woesebacteria bacterium]